MKKIYVKIDGIHCQNCLQTITKQLSQNQKIKDVEIINNIAHISYNKKLTNKEIIDSITKLGYITKDEYISNNIKDIDNKIKLKDFLIILTIILLIWFLVNKIFGFNIFVVIPKIDTNITYGMLFITGLFTSIHCISMCGAINLIAIVDSKAKNFKKPILYNIGRVASYTIIGAVAGLIGNVISINQTITGIIILITSLIMLALALSMLGLIKLKLPHIKIKSKTKNSFVIGLLNGFMPCGPLQAMQVYALSTTSALKGALSMFLFALGTVPLMLLVGIIYNLFKGKRRIIINKIASVLILILSLVMVNRGLLALKIDITKPFDSYKDYTASKIDKKYQIIEFDLTYNNYKDILIQKDIPVKMIINVDEKYLTGCNNGIIINDFNIRKKLKVGKNIIEFTPKKKGTYTYTCWMNMIKNNIKVIDNKNYFEVKK